MKLHRVICAALFGILLGGSQGNVLATSIAPGFDLFMTDPGSTFVDLTGIGAGIVPLRGNAIGPGNTDTIVERLDGINPFNVGDTDTIDIEIVALSLVSVDPITIGTADFDLDVTLSGNPQVIGSMTITHGQPNGGTFSAVLPVDTIVTLTDVSNPLNTFNVPFIDTFTSNGLWSHFPAAGDQHTVLLPSGGFHPGVDPLTGAKTLTLEQTLLAAHGVLPAMPEPSSFVLAAVAAVAGTTYLSRRRRRRR